MIYWAMCDVKLSSQHRLCDDDLHSWMGLILIFSLEDERYTIFAVLILIKCLSSLMRRRNVNCEFSLPCSFTFGASVSIVMSYKC